MTTESKQSAVPVEILTALGLSDEIVSLVEQERGRRLQEHLNISEARGTELYRQVAGKKSIESPLKLGGGIYLPVPEGTSFRSLLGYFRGYLAISPEELGQRTDTPLTPREIEDFYPNLKALIRGFGIAALHNRNLVIGVTALDMAYDGGILSSEEAKGIVINLTGTPEERFTAAEIIHSLNQRRMTQSLQGYERLGLVLEK